MGVSRIKLNRGFTIVELLIVIVVIAVLAAITIVAYNGIQNQARDSALKSDAQTVATLMEAHKAIHGSYALTATALNNGSGLPTGSGYTTLFHSDGASYCVSLTSTVTTARYFVASTQASPTAGGCPQDEGAQVTSLAGSGTLGFANGSGEAAVLASPVALSAGSGVLYFTDSSTSRVRQVTNAGVVSTIGGNGPTGTTEGIGNAALFNWPQAVSLGFNGHLYVADSNNQRIRQVPLNSTTTSTFAGLSTTVTTVGFTDATGTAARFNVPRGIAYDSTRGYLYVADSQNNRIRRITAAQVVDTLAGQSGGGAIDHETGTSAQFNYPGGLAIDGAGNIYVADTNNHRIRKVTPTGSVSTLAGSTSGNQDGTGAAARFSSPTAVAVTEGGVVYVADTNNHSIRKITPEGTVTTIAGSGSSGYANGSGTDALFNGPKGIALGSDGRLYVSDTLNHRIRVLTNI